ncbi:MAG: FHA domain-containing protein, partial [Planctomycetes bacterium]|nr:FHA domain-containing protein [Planctomycetota bacterium]
MRPRADGRGALAVRDLGSANGTKLNGARVAIEELAPDDVVQ